MVPGMHGSAGCTAVQGARQCRAHGCRMQGACRAGEAARAHWTRALSPGSPRAEPCHRILSASCSSRLLRAAASLCCSCSHWASAVSILFRDAFVFGRSRMLGRCGGLTSVPACIAPVRCKRAGSPRGAQLQRTIILLGVLLFELLGGADEIGALDAEALFSVAAPARASAPGGPRSCCSAAISHCVRKTRPPRQAHVSGTSQHASCWPSFYVCPLACLLVCSLSL